MRLLSGSKSLLAAMFSPKKLRGLLVSERTQRRAREPYFSINFSVSSIKPPFEHLLGALVDAPIQRGTVGIEP